MSVNQIKIKGEKIYIRSFSAVVIFLCIVFASAQASAGFSEKRKLPAKRLKIAVENKAVVIRVPAGGDLQAAINRAKSGDIIELQAGATYYGEIKLPAKPLTDFITIQTSAVRQLPEERRINPAQTNLLAKIVTRGKGISALTTANGAHHFRFVGIEFAPTNADYIYNLVYFGADESDKLSDVPHHLEIDRCYFHPYKTGVTRRALALNSATTVVKNSYFAGFAFPGEETQAICGWTGTKNVKILNNYLEAGAENILIGGSDPASAALIPADIEVRGNHLNKPAEWKGKVVNKCLFELKNGKRVRFIDNYLENNWSGSAFRITVRNEAGTAPFSTIEDALIENNVIDGAGEGINILGRDDSQPSQTLKRLNIVNNLFLRIGDADFVGKGYFIQMTQGEDILVANNTVFNTGSPTRFYGEFPKNFLFRDNIVNHGDDGIVGVDGIQPAAWRKLYQNNVVVNNKKISPSAASFPPGNFWAQDIKSVGFVDFANKDFRLAPGSRFKAKGAGKTDIGSNLSVNVSAK